MMIVKSVNGACVINWVTVGPVAVSADDGMPWTMDVNVGRQHLVIINPGTSEVNLGDSTVIPGGGLPVPPNYGLVILGPEHASGGRGWHLPGVRRHNNPHFSIRKGGPGRHGDGPSAGRSGVSIFAGRAETWQPCGTRWPTAAS